MVAIEVAIAILTASAGADAAVRHDGGHERHHQHAAADAEQAGEKARAAAEHEQFGDQRGIDVGHVDGSLRRRRAGP